MVPETDALGSIRRGSSEGLFRLTSVSEGRQPDREGCGVGGYREGCTRGREHGGEVCVVKLGEPDDTKVFKPNNEFGRGISCHLDVFVFVLGLFCERLTTNHLHTLPPKLCTHLFFSDPSSELAASHVYPCIPLSAPIT